jgi:F0F1-type ATP synthase assembly protein I
MRALALVGQLGFTVAGGVVAGVAAGWALDRWAGTRAVFTIAGILVGLAGGALAAYRLLMGFTRDGGERDDGKRNDGQHGDGKHDDGKRDGGK